MKRTPKAALGALASLMLLAACETPAYDPNDPNRNRRTGAVGGAIAGGLAGAALGDGSRGDEILAGAVLGGLAGGVIGNQLDKQAAELDRDLGNGIAVIRQGDALIVRMPQDILFAVNSSTVGSGLRADLFTLADSLQTYPNTTVEITGHTDTTGTWEYNRQLSQRRAEAVAGILTSAGVAGRRLRTFGAGYDQPIASNQTEEGRRQNRRVDITIREN